MNRLYYGDNLKILRNDIADESVDLIYLDPPFNSKRSYNVLFKSRSSDDPSAQIEAFDDTWNWSQESEALYLEMISGGAPTKVADVLIAMRGLLGDNDVLAYLVMMTARLVELHRVLKPTGSLYLHCDPTASHYLKVVLDAIFGLRNFRNELVWHYSGWNKHLAQHFERRHDVIFFYAKSKDQTFNGYGEPWESEEQYLKVRKQKLHVDEDGRKYVMSDRGGGKRIKRYLEEAMQYGRPVDSVWDMDKLNNSASEALGYPTQKPLALLERIIQASSNPGDVVLDPFCGCGTAVDAAQKLGRRWIGIDITYLAIDLIQKRLRNTYGDAITGTFEVSGVPSEMAAAQALFDKNPFDFERWAVSMISGLPNEKQVGDKGVDGVIRFWLADGVIGNALVSVKGGKSLKPEMVQALGGAVDQHNAQLGVFVCLGNPTPGMIEAEKKSGTFLHDLSGTAYPKIQILTIAEILAGKRPKMPTPISPFKKAKQSSGQLSMLE